MAPRIMRGMSEPVDILIVGGGLVGASLACALDGAGRRVALVEAVPAHSAAPPSFDERNLALAAASLNALRALGVLAHLATPPAPIRHIHVSRAGDFGAVRLDAAEYGREAFGGVVVARELGNALEARLSALASLRRHCPAKVVALEAFADGWRVGLERDGVREVVETKLLVAADGTRSFVREALGIGTIEHDYGQTLFVSTVAADRAPDGRAWERFTDTGPVALLPRADGHYGAIMGVADEDAAAVAALSDADYLALLQARAGGRAGRLRRVGRRSRYPVRRVLAERLTAPRAVVIGNAAQTIHPVGAQGFNLGLRDALTLAELVADGGDPGEPARLARYPVLRREDRERTLAFSDGLARLTANPSFPMHVLRSLGLLLLDRLPGLKAPLVGGAMGWRGADLQLTRGGAA
ncbi:2-octaprenyl-6-methoxyphenol hydroxylase [Rehaibacterium terrae]|jgi:2-octaprenyl-6-methoxyphenol hydroxylase|uniref:2-octaprenyl-6-methoxyphenol hydroxylase n=2 Tax=Rehaibacterium terrae TaxID=1341696 RepID=A0A7W7Y1Y8_9GAMM|nr:2-octaprenyl-6-methoxyphenol hydroxylase [Rehaibacterium terrae]